ncbi:MAG: hypothetical protein IIT49_04170, partial [Clostridia bacterium]|nr:hypothetical protein [Clostridia bacterium]
AISELWDEGIKAKLTVGITPILAEQLNDEHLQEGFVKYIDARVSGGDLCRRQKHRPSRQARPTDVFQGR